MSITASIIGSTDCQIVVLLLLAAAAADGDAGGDDDADRPDLGLVESLFVMSSDSCVHHLHHRHHHHLHESVWFNDT